MFTNYIQLDTVQQRLVNTKIVERTNAPRTIVHEILSRINPPIKIVNQEVILSYDMLMLINEKCKRS